ncbi:unnamed protein product [Adineta ricciae]|uniref:1-acyl-sn-glycerol-3-phosphate acyltransferase n=2 Tax=Adineta ricciae TaxID=249248 RepID=A0A815NDE7_ADIRI|nr:unnamed protein product [Adineta ricciae]
MRFSWFLRVHPPEPTGRETLRHSLKQEREKNIVLNKKLLDHYLLTNAIDLQILPIDFNNSNFPSQQAFLSPNQSLLVPQQQNMSTPNDPSRVLIIHSPKTPICCANLNQTITSPSSLALKQQLKLADQRTNTRMTICSLCPISLIAIFVFIYILVQYVLNEKQIYMLKYGLYTGFVMLLSVIIIPVFLIRPRNALNIRIASLILNPVFTLFGTKYRLEDATVLDKEGPCVIVANHQSSIDFIGMMRLWPEHIRYCTILAKKELFYAFPFGLTAWLAGLEYVDRKNRERSSETMRQVTKKVQEKSLRLWVFPEGTRNMTETFLPFKFGAFRLAIDAQVPIVPVVFSSYKSIYNADKASHSYFWRPGCVTIKCLEPIETKGMTIEKDLARLTEMTRQRMMNAYQTIKTITNDKKDE